ncbi:MAG: amidohydrolase [Clostridia bacterium]|nr:amidohydrolase [Clostridia bacterium]
MSTHPYERHSETEYPHARDVLEREVSENGFAAGWCMHAKPVPDYYFDVHVHYADRSKANIHTVIAPEAACCLKMGVKRSLLLIRIHGLIPPTDDKSMESLQDEDYTVEALRPLLAGFPLDESAVLAAWLHHSCPEPQLIHAAKGLGMRAIKLHNAPMITLGDPAESWLTPAWQETFAAMTAYRMPVLWHVTQRLPSSDYTGGGRNTYWQDGWKNGVRYGNEELLQVFLTCCARNPGIPFIGAHQLHIGWERLDKLFTGYPNLYVDTTVGCQLRIGDTFYPHDKDFLRGIFIKWADRILFGTDTFWRGCPSSETQEVIRMSQNFIERLDLPECVLRKVCHENAERLLSL